MNLIFDSIIFGFLLADGVLVYALFSRMGKMKPTLFWILLLSSALPFFVVFYGSFIEPRLIIITEQNIQLNENSTHTIRVALASDFHAGIYKKADFVKHAVEKINALKPDIILLAGDFLFGEKIHTEYLSPLRNLRAAHGIYAVLGNHDYEGNERVFKVVNALENMGIKILRNTSVEITLAPGKKILLGGVDEVWTHRADIEATFKESDPKLSKILLSHNPDIITKAIMYPIDLVLAGHTHGGQIRLPLLGPVPPLPTKLGRKYDRGLFQFKNLSTDRSTQLFITSGLGEMGPRARLFVPPEIVLLEVRF